MAVGKVVQRKLLLTDVGLQLQKRLLNTGTPVNLRYMAVGDGGVDTIEMPTLRESQQRLYNEVYRVPIMSIQALEDQDINKFLVTGFISKEESGGYYLKEFGLFTSDNELVYVGHLDNFYKYPRTSREACNVVIQVKIPWGYNYGLELPENKDYMFAMRSDLMQEEDALTGRLISKPYMYYMAQIVKV